MSQRPELKRFSDLKAGDFDRHPLWVTCHTVDYDEEWYEDTDEETVRPWTDSPSAAPSSSLLVRADFTAADGSCYTGFLTPSESSWPYETNHPHVFVGDFLIAFWEGTMPGAAQFRSRLYESTGKTADQLFPFRAVTSLGLLDPPVKDAIEGFYSITKFGAEPAVER